MSSGPADGFLTRWARRKAEAQRVEEAPAQIPAQAQESPAPETEEPLDLSTLPSIESLTADSDLSAFMRKGVPAELRDAAISRMWVADPAIRDYVGPYEMMWDFNTGEAFHGYGALAPDTDIARMVADIVSPRAPQPAEEEPPPAEVATIESASEDAALPEDAAAADSDETPSPEPPAKPVLSPRRRHGGATPV